MVSYWKNPVVLISVFLLLVSIRFNRNDLVVKRPLNDAAFYIANVQFLRGDELTYKFKGPFNERLLVTAVASILPFTPLTAINIANILFLLPAIYFLYLLLRSLSLRNDLVWAGLYLFVISFPTFYYSTIGYTDPGVLSMIFLGAYAIFTDRPWLFILAVLFGTLAKEGIILLIPVAVARAYSKSEKRWYATAAIGFLLFLGTMFLVKNYVNPEQANAAFYWKPLAGRIRFNLYRPNFYISSLLSVGIPGAVIVLFLFRKTAEIMRSWREDLPLWTGTLVAFVPWLYMIFAAFPDGRAFWTTSCFPVALAMVWWNRYGNAGS